VVAFQTRNPLHRAHIELTRRAAEEVSAHLLINPVVGLTRPGDVDYHTRVRCYRAALGLYPAGSTMLALLPLAMRMAGPREALWHALIRRNSGCSHFIVGRDHAGPAADRNGRPFYGPYDAQELAKRYEVELGIGIVPYREMVFVPDLDRFVPEDEVPAGRTRVSLSGSELRERLASGAEIPEWFSPPEVVAELRRSHPARAEQGCVIFFTGLSGSGKSTIARILEIKLLEAGRRVTMLDGDVVRKHLSSELGFSREHRDLNIERIGYVAAEVARHGGVAICAPIAPYDATRKKVRQMVEAAGGRFLLVYISTPIEVCEARDRKGLYAKARAGLIREFTGISDPYEAPEDSALTIDTRNMPAAEAAALVSGCLEQPSSLLTSVSGA
jgi:sulfate adenylyltransferase